MVLATCNRIKGRLIRRYCQPEASSKPTLMSQSMTWINMHEYEFLIGPDPDGRLRSTLAPFSGGNRTPIYRTRSLFVNLLHVSWLPLTSTCHGLAYEREIGQWVGILLGYRGKGVGRALKRRAAMRKLVAQF